MPATDWPAESGKNLAYFVIGPRCRYRLLPTLEMAMILGFDPIGFSPWQIRFYKLGMASWKYLGYDCIGCIWSNYALLVPSYTLLSSDIKIATEIGVIMVNRYKNNKPKGKTIIDFIILVTFKLTCIVFYVLLKYQLITNLITKKLVYYK